LWVVASPLIGMRELPDGLDASAPQPVAAEVSG
jgi:hypothetical protein